MPRIAKWKEKSQCVKYFRENQEFRFYDDTTPLNRVYETLYDLTDNATIDIAKVNFYHFYSFVTRIELRYLGFR